MSKTVVITGASKGIGANMAIRFAEKGYNVVMNYNNSVQSALILQRSLKESGYNVIAYKANVKNRLEVDLMIKEAISSAPKNRRKPMRMLIPRERKTDCFTMRPIFPFCPRICSCAVRLEIVVVKPAEVMLHASP